MANRRPQCRQVFWRSGWSTASERAGRAPTGQRRAGRGTTTSTGSVCRSSGRSRGSGSSPGPHPTLQSASTLPDCSGTSPARRSSRTPCGQARAPATIRPAVVTVSTAGVSWTATGSAVAAAPPTRCFLKICVVRDRSELAVMPAFRWRPQRSASCPGVAQRSGGFARGRASTPIRTWPARAIAPPPGSPGATTATARPQVAACARRAFRGTPVVARRNALSDSSSSTTPSGPARPFRLARVTRPGMTNTDVRLGIHPSARTFAPLGLLLLQKTKPEPTRVQLSFRSQ